MSKWKYTKELHDADQKLADIREKYCKSLRDADEKYNKLIGKMNDIHFAQLNENAKRTIEERGHFLSVESFEPFKDSVLSQLHLKSGSSRGVDKTISYLIIINSVIFGIIGILIGIISLILRFKRN